MSEHRRPNAAPQHSIVDSTVLRDVEKAKSLVAGAGFAALGSARGGAPFVTHVVGAPAADGTLLFLFSQLAEHTRTLAADARASLLFVDAVEGCDASAVARVTLQGTCAPVSDEERASYTATYVAAHPHAAHVATFSDFRPYRFVPDAVRWIGGFGRAAWLDVEEYRGAEVDAVASIRATALPIARAHRAAILEAVVAKLGDTVIVQDAQVLAVDSRGVDVLLRQPAPRAVRVALPDALAAALATR